jgi:hypothetical protein
LGILAIGFIAWDGGAGLFPCREKNLLELIGELPFGSSHRNELEFVADVQSSSWELKPSHNTAEV